MPIDTYIAGDPGAIDLQGNALAQTLHSAIQTQRYTLAGPRNAYQDVWQGSAGEAVADEAAELIKQADALYSASEKIGRALWDFSETLGTVQDKMAGARAHATANDLSVDGHLILDVPPLTPMTYDPSQGVPPEVTAKLDAHDAKVKAFEECVEKADDAIELYTDACQTLTEKIGDAVEDDLLVALTLEGLPGGFTYLGDDVLPPLADRLDRSRRLSSLLAGLGTGDMQDLVRHLFASINGLDDASIVSRLADLSNRTGGALDKYLLVAGILAGLQDGESLEQAILSEGGGFLAGAGATALTYGGAGALFGSSVGPVGTVVIGGVALVVGTGVGLVTSNMIDEWYDDKEFEELIRNGLENQGRPSG